MNGTLYCNKCGAPNNVSSQYCGRCGTALNPVASAAAGTGPGATTVPAPAVSYPVPAGYPAAMAGVRYGGFWIRVVAFIVDAIIVRVAVHPIAAIFGISLAASWAGMGMHHGLGALPFLFFGGGVLAALIIGASWLYEALMLSSSYQATVGKMILGMKVTDLYGNRISFARATGRHFAKWLSGMILCIGYIMVGLTERKQGLHDFIAETLVRRN